jgi:hypothetical protein
MLPGRKCDFRLFHFTDAVLGSGEVGKDSDSDSHFFCGLPEDRYVAVVFV